MALGRRNEGVEAGILRQGFDVRFLDDRRMLGRVIAVRHIIRTEKPDLVHTMLFHSDMLGRISPVGTGVKVLSTVVNTDYSPVRLSDPTISSLRLRLARSIDGWTTRHLAHHVHANSQAVKSAAIRDM